MKILSLVNYLFLLSKTTKSTHFFQQNNRRFINTLNSHKSQNHQQPLTNPTNPTNTINPTKPTPPKLCINCRYFMYEREEDENTMPEYGKCLYFEREPRITPEKKARMKNNLINYLVTGIKKKEPKKKTEWYYCSTARSFENMCGIEGKKYQQDVYGTNNMNMDIPTNH